MSDEMNPIEARVTGVERRTSTRSGRPYLAVTFETAMGERVYANYVLDHPVGLEQLEATKAAVRGRRCRLVARPHRGDNRYTQVVKVLPPLSGWRRVAIDGLRAGIRAGTWVIASAEVAAQMLEERA